MNIEEQEQNETEAKAESDNEYNQEQKNLLSKKRLRNKVVKKIYNN